MELEPELDADQRLDPDAPGVKDRYIGCLLGMGIGDALAMPSRGMTRAQIASMFGRLESYQPETADSGETRVPAGQFTDNSELALCLAESLVSSNGFLDPDSAGYRFQQVLNSDYSHFLGRTTRRALETAATTGEYQNGTGGERSAGAGPAARVAPIALVHALSSFNSELFVREVLRSTLITHAHPEAVNGAVAIAFALRLVVRRELPPEMVIDEVLSFIDEDQVASRLRRAKHLLESGTATQTALSTIGTSGYVAETVSSALFLFTRYANEFRLAVEESANAGGATSSIGTITGALCGAWTGAASIPVDLVDGLDGRMYILMAAPTVLRVAQLRAGLYLQLHQR
jgi:ADP-ribosyl-[dinitrogen reductase] hydrolase